MTRRGEWGKQEKDLAELLFLGTGLQPLCEAYSISDTLRWVQKEDLYIRVRRIVHGEGK